MNDARIKMLEGLKKWQIELKCIRHGLSDKGTIRDMAIRLDEFYSAKEQAGWDEIANSRMED